VGPGPENGLQHGVSGRNTPRVGVAESSCLEWAEALARRGLGCLGIDAPDHGSRGTFTSFFSVDDLPALRDRFREMTFDLLQVERAAITFDLDGDAVPDVAPRLRYFGNSMGAYAVTSARSTLPRRHAGGLTPPP
jgi:alpha-beta hydrolase superfamily lysophospholipase